MSLARSVHKPVRTKPPTDPEYPDRRRVLGLMSSYQLRRVGASLKQITLPLVVFVLALQSFQILLMRLFV